jgi:hypothetical protein
MFSGDVAGERRGQVVAQGHPLLVVVLHGEDAGVRPVGSGRNFPRQSVYSNAGVSTGSKP